MINYNCISSLIVYFKLQQHPRSRRALFYTDTGNHNVESIRLNTQHTSIEPEASPNTSEISGVEARKSINVFSIENKNN